MQQSLIQEKGVGDVLAFAVQLVRGAGALLVDRFNQVTGVRSKSSTIDLVTEADLDSERFIVDAIRRQYPHHSVLSEEKAGREGAGDYLWLVDPLDGTVNYVHGFPVFCVTVALRYGDDLIVGVTYDPVLGELFTVEKGRGAFLNERPLRVSRAQRLVESLVATGFPYKRATMADNNLAEFNRILPKVQGVRRGGSAALDLAYVAAGRLDGYWESHLSPWDWAAGVLMVEEAGGTVTDRESKPWTPESSKLVATNGVIHEELLKVLSSR